MVLFAATGTAVAYTTNELVNNSESRIFSESKNAVSGVKRMEINLATTPAGLVRYSIGVINTFQDHQIVYMTDAFPGLLRIMPKTAFLMMDKVSNALRFTRNGSIFDTSTYLRKKAKVILRFFHYVSF